MRRINYQVYYRQVSPFAIIGVILLCITFFFFALPIFLAALAVFGVFAAWFAWRMKKTMEQVEKELLRQQQEADMAFSGDDPDVIDVTLEDDHRKV